jgi:hypothetical protein
MLIALYALLGNHGVYIGCGEVDNRYCSHKSKLLNGNHTKKVQKCFEQDGIFEFHILMSLNNNSFNEELLHRFEKVIISYLFEEFPYCLLNSRNPRYSIFTIREHEVKLFNMILLKLVETLNESNGQISLTA